MKLLPKSLAKLLRSSKIYAKKLQQFMTMKIQLLRMMPVLSDSTSGTTRLNTQLLNHSTNIFTFDKWIDKGPKKQHC